LVTIRNWLRFVFHVGQPERPVSGVPGLPSRRQARHFGFVPSSWQGAQCWPAITASSVAFRVKMPLSVSMLTVWRGEVLYFQPAANQKQKASLRFGFVPSNATEPGSPVPTALRLRWPPVLFRLRTTGLDAGQESKTEILAKSSRYWSSVEVHDSTVLFRSSTLRICLNSGPEIAHTQPEAFRVITLAGSPEAQNGNSG
jgi:hypothetical protein